MRIPTTHAEISHRLHQYHPWETVSLMSAASYLEERLTSYQLLALYQTFFPDPFVSSTASLYERHSLEGHTHRELEFLEELDRHIPVGMWTIERAGEAQLDGLPVLDMGIDVYEEDAIERSRPAVQILLPLSREGRHWLETLDGNEWYEGQFNLGLSQIQHPDRVSSKHLRQRFNQQRPPLRFVPLLLSLLDKTTGNVWLDCTNNEAWFGYGGDTVLRWTEANLRLLMVQWRQAEIILSRCEALLDWLEGDLTPRFNKVLELWNPLYN
ncbi:hypothetical protein ACKFKG_30340 [Phormidesmis sp. 146-35]